MRISVVIPVLNEAGQIADVVERTRAVGDCEIVVVDGGSADETVALSRAADLVLTSPRGRAAQQNAGAARASGEVLLFLHADCRLPPLAFDLIRAALARPRCVGGCFRQRIDGQGGVYRLLEWGNALRVRTIGWAYGDQGIFLRRSVFEELGGFPDVPLMEDLLLMKKVRRAGSFRLLDARLGVSARRWRARGVVRQTLLNWRLVLLAQCGVPLERLAARYHSAR